MGRVMGPGFILSKQSEAVEERLTNVIRRSSFEVSFEEKVAVCQIKEDKDPWAEPKAKRGMVCCVFSKH